MDTISESLIPSPASAEPAGRTPVWLRFALLCTLFLLAAIWLEPYLAPLNRSTARMCGMLLSWFGSTPHVRGDVITLSGFSVRIVTECTPLYPILLYASFISAWPASRQRTLSGLIIGGAILTIANTLRIALVTTVGLNIPWLFDIAHVYLGQVAMLMLVFSAALGWLRWSEQAPAALPFVIRATAWATVLFLPWLSVNVRYVEVLDRLVAVLFSLLMLQYMLITPRPFGIYNHTFAVPLLLSLILSAGGLRPVRRFLGAVAGVLVVAGWHAMFRVSHVLWTALDIPEMEPLHEAIYLLGQFLLPFLIWMCVVWLASKHIRTFRA